MAVTLSSADAALKSVYLDVVAEQLNTKANPFMAQINKTTDDVWGKEVRKLVTYGLNSGVAAGSEDGNLPKAGANKYKQFVLSLKNLYGTLEISDKAVRASANNEGAFVNLLNAEMEGLVKASNMNFSRMLFGDGTGIIGEGQYLSSNSLLLIGGEISAFCEGMVVDFVSQSGELIEAESNRTITEVNEDDMSITLTGASINEATIDTGVYLVPHGAYNSEITGLKKIFDVEAPTLYGVDRASNKWMNPTVRTVSKITELEIQKVIDEIEYVSGSAPNFIVCSYGVRRALQKVFSDNHTKIDTMTLNGGYTTMSYNGIPIVADRYCPNGTLYLLNTNDFNLHQLCDWQWLCDDDGRVLKQIPGKPVYTATLVKYAELLCSRPCGQGMIKGITEG